MLKEIIDQLERAKKLQKIKNNNLLKYRKFYENFKNKVADITCALLDDMKIDKVQYIGDKSNLTDLKDFVARYGFRNVSFDNLSKVLKKDAVDGKVDNGDDIKKELSKKIKDLFREFADNKLAFDNSQNKGMEYISFSYENNNVQEQEQQQRQQKYEQKNEKISWLDKVEKNYRDLRMAPDEIKNNKDVVRAAVKQNPYVIDELPDAIKNEIEQQQHEQRQQHKGEVENELLKFEKNAMYDVRLQHTGFYKNKGFNSLKLYILSKYNNFFNSVKQNTNNKFNTAISGEINDYFLPLFQDSFNKCMSLIKERQETEGSPVFAKNNFNPYEDQQISQSGSYQERELYDSVKVIEYDSNENPMDPQKLLIGAFGINVKFNS